MAKRKKPPRNFEPRILNRRAKHDYDISEKLEVGMKLLGTEVKSIRHGHVSLAEGYVAVNPNAMTLQLHNVDIAHYPQAGPFQHDQKRVRLLLAHKREIKQLYGRTTAKGVTIIPLALYFKNGMAKLEIGVGVGKRQADKRQDIRKKEADKEIRKAMTRRVIG
ncbi:SsrA-binding protein SmpB [Algisphaera agarilytica]|uniref:SsrA-binding protein n=1 Tax=Algisphaera agarilytica TaxID=1385975 RepID=A0A7X0LMD3_9BACT|nr:SsrA-binding protein SmpB [Algisphaera agarilytica]MBB6431521.1 SsrA-binding protein [Algisphaera agarilytica]